MIRKVWYSLSMFKITSGRLWKIFLGNSTFISYNTEAISQDTDLSQSTYILENIVSLANVSLVDKIERVPLEVHGFVRCFRLPVRMELLVLHQIDIEVDSGLEAFLFHPVAAIAVELDSVAAHTPQILHNLRSN